MLTIELTGNTHTEVWNLYNIFILTFLYLFIIV